MLPRQSLSIAWPDEHPPLHQRTLLSRRVQPCLLSAMNTLPIEIFLIVLASYTRAPAIKFSSGLIYSPTWFPFVDYDRWSPMSKQHSHCICRKSGQFMRPEKRWKTKRQPPPYFNPAGSTTQTQPRGSLSAERQALLTYFQACYSHIWETAVHFTFLKSKKKWLPPTSCEQLHRFQKCSFN